MLQVVKVNVFPLPLAFCCVEDWRVQSSDKSDEEAEEDGACFWGTDAGK